MLIAVAGCDVAFRLEAPPIDAPACLPLDEECDGQVDAEDSCPADADAPDEDDDGDGLGNACDPNRTSVMDSLVRFDGFNELDTSWVMVSGDWRIQDGAMVQSAAADGEIGYALNPRRTRPSAEVYIDELAPLISARAGVFGADGAARLACSVVVTADASHAVHLEGFLISVSKPLPGTGPVRMMMGQAANGQFYCRARRLDGLDVELIAGFVDTAVVTIDGFGLFSALASARFTSITVYTAP